MKKEKSDKNNPSQDWQRVDARILGQILAAQNILFVLPDESRIAEYFSQALSGVPGVKSCFVCLGNLPTHVGTDNEVCSECMTLRQKERDTLDMPHNFTCGLALKKDIRIISLRTNEHTFGFFIFQTESSDVIELYWPFLNNLANYIALSLENRLQKRMLEKANEELEAFTYSVSHDLRAPLRGIDGFSQVLLEEYYDQIDAQGKNYLERIRLAAQRMAQLIDDMLNLSRVSRSEMNIQQVNLSKMVREIADGLRTNQPERHVEFVIQEGIKVQGDGRLLHIVLENLINNAWKFTSNHPTACIEFGLQQKNDGVVYFVRDDGAGFDMNYAQKLFGAFQRLHTTTEFPGTGIGLATVQRVIHRHGGDVWAEGEVEKGATFYFTIS